MGLALITMTMTPLLAYRDTKHIFMHKMTMDHGADLNYLKKNR